MLERMSLLKIAMAAVFAASLAALPLTIQAQETTEPATKSDTPAKAKKKAVTKKAAEPKTTTQAEPKSTPTETKSGRPLTAGQIAARERQRQCGEEWRGLSDEVKKQKGPTWPKYWSACNTRLKGAAQAKGKKA